MSRSGLRLVRVLRGDYLFSLGGVIAIVLALQPVGESSHSLASLSPTFKSASVIALPALVILVLVAIRMWTSAPASSLITTSFLAASIDIISPERILAAGGGALSDFCGSFGFF